MKMHKLALGIALAVTTVSTQAHGFGHFESGIQLVPMGTYESGVFNEGAAEIAAYDKRSKRVFVTNANDNTLDVSSIRNPRRPKLLFTVDLAPEGMLFIDRGDSPIRAPLLVVTNEVSGSTIIYKVIRTKTTPVPFGTGGNTA